MASGTPVIRQISWLGLIPQVALFLGLIYLFRFLQIGSPALFAVAAYLLLAFGLRFFFAKYHRYGMAFIKRQAFEEAILYFEHSYEYFRENRWLDRYRAIFLLSSSSISYREMALVNIAYCYSQLGDGRQAKAYYKRALAEFPESGIARAGLNMLNSVREKE